MMGPLMAVTVCHRHLESQPRYDEILVLWQVILTALLLLQIIPCSGQLAATCRLGLALCLHWHRCFLSDCPHSCHLHGSRIGSPLPYYLHHWCAWWCSWSGRGIPTIRLVCLTGSFGSWNIWHPYGQLLGWIGTLVVCPPTLWVLQAQQSSHAHVFSNAVVHYWISWTWTQLVDMSSSWVLDHRWLLLLLWSHQ